MTRPLGQVFKHLLRDLESIFSMKQTCDLIWVHIVCNIDYLKHMLTTKVVTGGKRVNINYLYLKVKTGPMESPFVCWKMVKGTWVDEMQPNTAFLSGSTLFAKTFFRD